MADEEVAYCAECKAPITADTVEVSYLTRYGHVAILKVVCVYCHTLLGTFDQPQ